MDMNGEQLIHAPKERVWAALNDPEILKRAIPGCEILEKDSETSYVATIVAKIGPVKATFKGKVTLSDIDPPNGYAITGEGTGGVAGFGKGGAKVTLETADQGTRLKYTAQAQVGGKLAQLGSRLIDTTARKLADDFFERFSEAVASSHSGIAGGDPSSGETAKPTPMSMSTAPMNAVPQAQTSLAIPDWIWIGGLCLVAFLILWSFR